MVSIERRCSSLWSKTSNLFIDERKHENFQVVDQCEKYVWADEKVNFALYYETLCPDCRQFMTTQLWTAYQSILDIINITLVPYGNARETYNPTTKLYDFVCQHGPNECLGNLIHVKFESCFSFSSPTRSIAMPFFLELRFVLSSIDQRTYGNAVRCSSCISNILSLAFCQMY